MSRIDCKILDRDILQMETTTSADFKMMGLKEKAFFYILKKNKESGSMVFFRATNL